MAVKSSKLAQKATQPVFNTGNKKEKQKLKNHVGFTE
jgi:hypothetical protein